MPDIMDALKKECGDLYQKNATIVRTLDGKFGLMPWQTVYRKLEELANGYFVTYKWSFGSKDYATLWRDKKGKVYAGAPATHIPSDAPFKTGLCKPIYFEELTPEEAEKLIREAFSNEHERERKIELHESIIRSKS
jgi:20S proteasome alpha/beta subunit